MLDVMLKFLKVCDNRYLRGSLIAFAAMGLTTRCWAIELRFFDATGFGGVAEFVTNDGLVMGDYYDSAERKYKAWAASKDLGLGPVTQFGLPAGTIRGSANGRVFAGVTSTAGVMSLFRWTPTTGTTVVGTVLQPPNTTSTTIDVSENGNVITGFNFTGSGTFAAFSWNAAGGGIRTFTNMPLSVSNNGTIAGRFIFNNLQKAATWTSSTSPVLIPALPGSSEGYANDITPDGKCVVGYMESNGNNAFLWQEGIGTISLFEGHPEQHGLARAISADGKLVGGNFYGLGESAFIWTAATGARLLDDVLREAGLSTGGDPLALVTDISANGRFLVGNSRGGKPFLIDMGVPEPTAWQLMLPGLFVTIGLIRRRARQSQRSLLA